MVTFQVDFTANECPFGKCDEVEEFALEQMKKASSEIVKEIRRKFGFTAAASRVSITRPVTVMMPSI